MSVSRDSSTIGMYPVSRCHSAAISGRARKRNSSAQASWRSLESERTIARPAPPVGTSVGVWTCPGMKAHPTSKDESAVRPVSDAVDARMRSEEHTSELQSRGHLVCRLLLEKKKKLTGIDDFQEG